jgi:hypothetical protein
MDYGLKTAKNTLPPRFFPSKVTCASLIGGFQAGFAVLSVQFLC